MSQPEGAHPGRRALAALRAQPLRAVRGAPGAGAHRAEPLDAARGHGGRAAAHRRRPRRGPRRVRVGRRARQRSSAPAWWPPASSTTAAASPTRYPANPNGSPGGITALTTPDGRVTILMPHPERVFRAVQHSWHPYAGPRRPLDAHVPQRAGLGRRDLRLGLLARSGHGKTTVARHLVEAIGRRGAVAGGADETRGAERVRILRRAGVGNAERTRTPSIPATGSRRAGCCSAWAPRGCATNLATTSTCGR